MISPERIQAIGEEIAIRWKDGTETYCSMEMLRKESPSAENKGETDLTGNRIGGCDQENFPGVKATSPEKLITLMKFY